ncbi:MAG: hypothetical protein GX601_06115, partial [Anaerolineales bacterium]|nr:hypothetical protein [Anaerolineales bacterium]
RTSRSEPLDGASRAAPGGVLSDPLVQGASAAWQQPGPKARSSASADERAHALLDAHLAQIRAFLAGRAARPTDEVLCEWVRDCYTFELFQEGNELFNLVDPTAVNDWLYARTGRLAQVCRIRAQHRE